MSASLRIDARKAVGAVLLALFLQLPAYPQVAGGSIVGVVKDPSGALISGVRVSTHNQETNEVQQTTTNKDGYYEFP
jgi:hypothetical protein